MRALMSSETMDLPTRPINKGMFSWAPGGIPMRILLPSVPYSTSGHLQPLTDCARHEPTIRAVAPGERPGEIAARGEMGRGERRS
jgi:hypothetical protein